MEKKLQELIDTSNFKELQKMAVVKKHEGDFTTAKLACEAAIGINKLDRMSYENLAKLFYLSSQRQESIKNHLIALHLSIQNYQKLYHQKQDVERILGRIETIRELDITKLSSVAPEAIYLLLDPIPLRHLGHSILDLETGLTNILELDNSVLAYKSELQEKSIYIVDELIEIELSIYAELGKYFAIENLQWTRIDYKNPQELYEDFTFIYQKTNDLLQEKFSINKMLH